MKLSLVLLVAGTAVALGDWFSSTVYNKWHETELERWLSDNNIPYPTPADRKELENLVKNNWDDYVSKPYSKWDVRQLTNYLTSQGKEVKKGTEKDAKSLASQVQSYWYETSDEASDAYKNVQEWIFDTWTESQLKSFLDHHGVPNPSPRTRDSLLFTARSNFQSIANKAGETINYPGDWIYSSWSESDLKAWLDERGIPAPQPTQRDKLIAALRRNSRAAGKQASSAAASASKSADAAQHSLSNQLLDTWSESQIKEWLDKQGVKVPQGSKLNEIRALARKQAAKATGNDFNAATSSAGNFVAQATNDVYSQGRYYYDLLLNQFGLASKDAQKSISSFSSVASVSASKASIEASKSAESAASQASKSAPSLASQASKSAASAASVASKSGSSAASVAASVASKSGSSAASVASKSGTSAASKGKSAAASGYSAAKAEL